MSFYSYKNANSDVSPGAVCGNVLNGLNKRVCIQVKNVYDACLQQEQLDDKEVIISNIVPVLPSGCGCNAQINRGCNCTCDGNECTCSCSSCGAPISHEEAVENASNSPCPLPQPFGAWTFESCRSSTIKGAISNLSIERMCDRPQFARVRCNVDVPIDILFTDQHCQEWMGQSSITVAKDVLLCVPEESIIPFTLESLVSAICVSGSYIGSCTFKITICVSVVLKVLAEVDIMVPTYGFCEIPPCEEFAESVCDEFFSLPLFPQSSCAFEEVDCNDGGNGTVSSATGGSFGCPPGSSSGNTGKCSSCNSCRVSTCSHCGTTCASSGSICPRCGSTMTTLS